MWGKINHHCKMNAQVRMTQSHFYSIVLLQNKSWCSRCGLLSIHTNGAAIIAIGAFATVEPQKCCIRKTGRPIVGRLLGTNDPFTRHGVQDHCLHKPVSIFIILDHSFSIFIRTVRPSLASNSQGNWQAISANFSWALNSWSPTQLAESVVAYAYRVTPSHFRHSPSGHRASFIVPTVPTVPAAPTPTCQMLTLKPSFSRICSWKKQNDLRSRCLRGEAGELSSASTCWATCGRLCTRLLKNSDKIHMCQSPLTICFCLIFSVLNDWRCHSAFTPMICFKVPSAQNRARSPSLCASEYPLLEASNKSGYFSDMHEIQVAVRAAAAITSCSLWRSVKSRSVVNWHTAESFPGKILAVVKLEMLEMETTQQI